MKIWLDDIRPAPEGFIWCKSAYEAIGFIQQHWKDITEISLDHDLGDDERFGTGYQVICAIEELCFLEQTIVPIASDFKATIRIHSANPVGIEKMRKGIEKINSMRQL